MSRNFSGGGPCPRHQPVPTPEPGWQLPSMKSHVCVSLPHTCPLNPSFHLLSRDPNATCVIVSRNRTQFSSCSTVAGMTEELPEGNSKPPVVSRPANHVCEVKSGLTALRVTLCGVVTESKEQPNGSWTRVSTLTPSL